MPDLVGQLGVGGAVLAEEVGADGSQPQLVESSGHCRDNYLAEPSSLDDDKLLEAQPVLLVGVPEPGPQS